VPPKSSIPWFTIGLAAFVLGGFAWGFWQGGLDVGTDLLLQWVLATGILGAIGCAVAGGHPLSILVAFLASPITPLHPALASGTDRKSTRLNSSHVKISYAVFCLKKKNER